MTWPASIPTIGSGGYATSAQFNDYRDALSTIGGAWAGYTPTWAGSTTSPTLGSSSVAGRYRLTGKTVDVHIAITIGAGFSAGSGGYTLTLPPGLAPLNTSPSEAMGFANLRDVSVPTSRGYHPYYVSSTTIALFKPDDGAIWGAAAPWVPAAGDIISVHLPSLEVA